MPSAPTAFAAYALNATEINRINIETLPNIAAFEINLFNLFIFLLRMHTYSL